MPTSLKRRAREAPVEDEQENGPPGERRGAFLRGLEIFVAVATTGGISAAARNLGMGQPSVTQRVQALEEMLGAPLLHRHQTGIELTAAGRIALSYSERLLHTRDEMLNALRGHATLTSGTLRVAGFPHPGH